MQDISSERKENHKKMSFMSQSWFLHLKAPGNSFCLSAFRSSNNDLQALSKYVLKIMKLPRDRGLQKTKLCSIHHNQYSFTTSPCSLCSCNAIAPFTLILHTDPHCLLGLCTALTKMVTSLTKSGQKRIQQWLVWLLKTPRGS